MMKRCLFSGVYSVGFFVLPIFEHFVFTFIALFTVSTFFGMCHWVKLFILLYTLYNTLFSKQRIVYSLELQTPILLTKSLEK